MAIAEALAFYGEKRAKKVKDPARIGYAIAALLPFWGHLPVSAITEEMCEAYGEQRLKVVKRDPVTNEPLQFEQCSDGTIRKELGTLRSALRLCEARKRLLNPPEVHLPPKPEPHDRWLTRKEAAKLLLAAWRNPRSKHLAKFILVSLYTGTRKTAVLRMRFMANTSGGWVDTTGRVMYRRSNQEAETAKKRPPAPIPSRLLPHLKRWEASGSRWVVDHKGNGVGSLKTAWKTAVEAAGLQGSGVTPHTLRHTAITWAMQTGLADAWELGGFFGVSPETMLRVYAHHHPDYQKDAADAVSKGGRKL